MTASSPRLAMCCAPGFRAPPGSRSTTPARATKPPTASARRWATPSSPGSVPPPPSAGYDDYIINAEALAYMRERALAAHVIARLVEHPDRCFANQKAWNAHLDKLGIAALRVNPDPLLIAT